MEPLGWLTWWTVTGDVIFTRTDARHLISEVGLEIPPPAGVLPVDAFRRLTGSWRGSYQLPDGADVTFELYPMESTTRKVLVRHIVRTVSKGGVNLEQRKVGEATFVRNGDRRAAGTSGGRLVLRLGRPDPQVSRFAEELRQEYMRSKDTYDHQAGRRWVRAFLTSVGAVHLDGAYILNSEHDADRLTAMVTGLGKNCRCHTVPIIDDEPRRQMVAEARNQKEV